MFNKKKIEIKENEIIVLAVTPNIASKIIPNLNLNSKNILSLNAIRAYIKYSSNLNYKRISNYIRLTDQTSETATLTWDYLIP